MDQIVPSMIKQLIHDIFGLRNGDIFTFVYDEEFVEILPLIQKECAETSATFKSLKLEDTYDDQEMPKELGNLLVDDIHNVFLFGLKYPIWHTKERKKESQISTWEEVIAISLLRSLVN